MPVHFGVYVTVMGRFENNTEHEGAVYGRGRIPRQRLRVARESTAAEVVADGFRTRPRADGGEGERPKCAEQT